MPSASRRSSICAGLLLVGYASLCACSPISDETRHRDPLDDAAREIAVEVVRSNSIGEIWTRQQLPIEVGVYVANERLRRRCGEKYDGEARAFVRLATSPSFPLIVRRSDRPTRMAIVIASDKELPSYSARWDRAFGTEQMTSLYYVRDRVTGDSVNVEGRSSTIEVAVAIVLITPKRLSLLDNCDVRVRELLSILMSQFKAYAAGGLAASRKGFNTEDLTDRALGIIAEAVHGELAAGRPVTKQAVLARLGAH